MTAPALASRVMKARRESMCPTCQAPIRVGQQIAKRGYWQHIEHVIERNRTSTGESQLWARPAQVPVLSSCDTR
jgi:hypothetical protein